MALINKAKREINAKIVYYGREGNGKALSLRYIYDRLKPCLRGEFKTMQSIGNLLQFFDFTPFEQPMFGGYRICFHVYTITGGVANPAAWKMTLKGADGIVLVTNSVPAHLTDEQNSLACLRDFVGGYGISLHDIPMVVQVEKDGQIEHLQPADLCLALGIPDIPASLAQSTTGEGVLEALSQLSPLVMARIAQNTSLLDKPEILEETILAKASDLTSVEIEPETYLASLDGLGLAMNSSVKIPLNISVAGENRHLMLTVSLSEE